MLYLDEQERKREKLLNWIIVINSTLTALVFMVGMFYKD